jgi:DNA invertase Pin-like site-specific DNA recombinase
MIGSLRLGDMVVVWKLDRLGRTILELIKLINHFNDNDIGFKCINDNFIDTTSPHGKFVFSIFSALAEYERELNRERSMAGLEAARARGRIGGRPSGLSHDVKLKAAAAASLYNKGESVSSILKILSIGSKATLYKYLRHEGLKIGK